MKKVINIFIVSLALFSVLSLSIITAYATPSVELVEVSKFGALIESGAYVYPTFDVVKDDSFFTVTTSEPAVVFYGYKMTLNYPAYMKVESGYYFQIGITTRQNSPSFNAGNLPSTSVSVIASDGVIYDLGVTTEMQSSSAGNYYVAIAGGYVGAGEPINISDIVITSDCPVGTVSTATPSSYIITVYPSVSVVPTPEQQRHEELMQQIEENTDKILNGWVSNVHPGEDLDSILDDYKSAEDSVYNSDDTKAKVEAALDPSGLPDPSSAGPVFVSTFLNDLIFLVIGPEYAALVFLSCSLGCSMLLIGRVFR